MKILITGGAGFIGSNLVKMALGLDHHILNVDKLTYAGNLASLQDIESHPNYQFSHTDINDQHAIRNELLAFQPDAVMHLAAESHVDRSIDGPREFIETNVVGTLNLLQASFEYWRSLPEESASRFRFLHVSTDEVYGSLGAEGYFTEHTSYDPRSPYSASKAASDHLARAWFHTYGLPVLVTNCSNNYGPYQFPEKLIPVVILKCLRGEPIPVYGNGEHVRDWLYVDDHCDALLTVLEKGQLGETYNIGGNNEIRNIDLVRLLCELMDELHPRIGDESPVVCSESDEVRHAACGSGNPQPVLRYADLISFVTDRPGHDARYAIDASKIKRDLGWQPKQDNQSGFRETVQWYLDNQDWWEAILSGDYRLDRLGITLPVVHGEK